ncbi:MAG: hypothetical protein LLG06_02710 [Desulfobacteraceae bacterium]|nr:hypothetical protein [Desulfobacteraceae bacterium]
MVPGDAGDAVRREVLRNLGGGDNAVEDVILHCGNPFSGKPLPPAPLFPMPEEPHTADWREYAAAGGTQVFACLRERLPQFCIPVRAGISKTGAYGDVMRRGKLFDERDFEGTLGLDRPELFRIQVHEHAAGALPVLCTSHRGDFETLLRALVHRGEPVEIHPALNAQFITGLLNWDRVRKYERQWRLKRGLSTGAQGWREELARVSMLEKWRLFDRIILVCEAPYSGVEARELGLPWDEKTWMEKSAILRVEHEFTHYAALRLFGTLGHGLLAEMICDWAGVTAAMGEFRASWELAFLGIGDRPGDCGTGRIDAYRGALGEEAMPLLCALGSKAAQGLELLSRAHYAPGRRMTFLLALMLLDLESLACDERGALFAQAYGEAEKLLGFEAGGG